MSEHQPVLLRETLDALAVQPGGRYVDATFGRGGHAAAVLERLGADGSLLVLDRDPEAIAVARDRHGDDARVTIVHDAFANLGAICAGLDWTGTVDGLLLDIGVSSPQLDDAGRGFSFQNDGPLDMRMDPTRGESAAQWLARASLDEITDVVRRYGEERHARRVARAIVAAREATPLTRTGQFAEIVAAAIPGREPGRHPATRVFQALRIHVNDELGELQAALAASLDVLAAGGKLCVIAFHSLEDRIVKRFMRSHALVDPVWRGLPDIPAHARPKLCRPARAVRASEIEIARNPRSRSAVLRAAERAQ